MPDDKATTGELYSQRIDALEAFIAYRLDAQDKSLEKLSAEATKAIDALIEADKRQCDRLRDLELEHAKVAEYREGHKETHTKERGALGTLMIIAATMAASWDKIF